jgi:hypothetical protein
MLFGKIDPVAQIVKQTTPFEQQTIDAEYITALARPYALGAESVNFQVSYGNFVKDDTGKITGFNNLFNDNVVLSGAIIANWGTNDAVILDALAEEQGTNVVETIDVDINVFF